MIKLTEDGYHINIENSPCLEDITTILECGVKIISMEDLSRKINEYKEIKRARGEEERGGRCIMPPVNPYLIKGVSMIEGPFKAIEGDNSTYYYPKEGYNKKLNILHCHGQDGKDREKPVDDWMLRIEASPDLRNVPILEIVRRILAEGETIDVLYTCNLGGYPKNAEDYPFLKNMLYPKIMTTGHIYITSDGSFNSSIMGFGGHNEELIVPESWKGLLTKEKP